MAAPPAAAAPPPPPIALHSLDDAFALAEAVAAGRSSSQGAAGAPPPQLPQLAEALERLQRRERAADGAPHGSGAAQPVQVLAAPHMAGAGAHEPLAFVEWRAPAALVGLHVL